jgi:hypothetical protein
MSPPIPFLDLISRPIAPIISVAGRDNNTTIPLGCQIVYFPTKNRNLGKFLEGTEMEDVGTFCGHSFYFYGPLKYFMAMWYILW